MAFTKLFETAKFVTKAQEVGTPLSTSAMLMMDPMTTKHNMPRRGFQNITRNLIENTVGLNRFLEDVMIGMYTPASGGLVCTFLRQVVGCKCASASGCGSLNIISPPLRDAPDRASKLAGRWALTYAKAGVTAVSGPNA